MSAGAHQKYAAPKKMMQLFVSVIGGLKTNLLYDKFIKKLALW